MATPAESALLQHVVAQMQANVEFLVSQNYISEADASAIVSRLPAAEDGAVPLMNVAAAAAPVPAPPGRRSVPAPPARGIAQARAVWGYNENGSEPDDLSFSPGDIVEIVEEVNDDWWMGRVHGKQALFPVNYVERIASTPSTASSPVSTPTGGRRLPPAMSPAGEKKAYKPFGAAHHGADLPPANGGVNSVGLQQDAAGQEQKKNKFGKYGNTMAHSAAGGVGFGAGAAIGGGLVRAIF